MSLFTRRQQMEQGRTKGFTSNTLTWLEAVLHERYGVNIRLHLNTSGASDVLALTLQGQPGQILFDCLEDAFQQSRSDIPCGTWNVNKEGYSAVLHENLPMPASEKILTPLIEQVADGHIVHYDILGLTYWMLTRKEEVGRTDLDSHQRFPASSSHAFNYGYLERPIVDEWLQILGQVIRRQWPQVAFRRNHFSMRVSHDVDAPACYAFLDTKALIRSVWIEIYRRGNLTSALMAPWLWLNSKESIHPRDPLNTFDWIMAQSERHGLSSAFYFICGRTDPLTDALYEPESPAIRKLMREIYRRGHEIGLHPSYNTFQRPDLIRQEADRLRNVCGDEGIEQERWGGRMHYLRWDQAVTLKALDGAGMNYDSTLGYADCPGFRCGTCFEYPAFDVISDQSLKLRVRPLVAMDCTVISKHYLGLGSTERAYERFSILKEACRRVEGVFTLLWHNSFFNSAMDFSIYQRLVSNQ